MAKPAKNSKPKDGSPPDITQPTPDQRLAIDETHGTILITVTGDPGESYSATVFSFVPPPDGQGMGTQISTLPLVENPPLSGQYSKPLSAGPVTANPPVGTNNRVIQVTDISSGDITGYAFAAIHGGSGSHFLSAETERCPNCDPSRPVPVALLLTLDSAVAAGACANCVQLNEPTALVHSKDAKYPCCWFSRPIDFCTGAARPGVWVLQKSDAYTWTLTLRRGDAYVVAYSLTTQAAKDCSFPLKLRRVGKPGRECKQWPRTVTIVPAP